MMTLLNFSTAIYWGQLSHCQPLGGIPIAQYSCSQKSAYGAVSAFAVLLFLTQLVFTSAVILWRAELIHEHGTGYDEVNSAGSVHHPYDEHIPHGSNNPSNQYSQNLHSTDL